MIMKSKEGATERKAQKSNNGAAYNWHEMFRAFNEEPTLKRM